MLKIYRIRSQHPTCLAQAALALMLGSGAMAQTATSVPRIRETNASSQFPGELTATEVASLEKQIAGWIEKLGDPNYAMRLQAQSELERIGVRALDQLHRASFDPNPQVASQARFLVQSNQFNWAWETDPFPVRRILENYTTAALYDKSTYIEQLDALENDEGLPALCRLVRYETQGCLAKKAALLLMRGKTSIAMSQNERRAMIDTLVNGTLSTAGAWVAQYAAQDSEIAIEPWLKTIQAEQELLARKSPDTSIEILNGLRRWVVEQIPKTISEQRNKALELARSIPADFGSAGANRNQQSIEFEQWALSVGLPELVREQHAELSELSLLNPRFGYLLAESYLPSEETDAARLKPQAPNTDKNAVANEIAELTSQRVSVDANGTRKTPIDPTESENSKLNQHLLETMQRNASQAFERAEMGEFLIRRGRFNWAETELRLAIKNREDEAEFATILTLTQLSLLLHEMGRNEEAAACLDKFVDRFEKEPMFKAQVSEQGADSLVSNYYLYQGDHAQSVDRTEEARQHYLKSIELAEDNVDAIIGMYRLPNQTEEQILERRKLQQRISLELRSEIDARERDLKRENPRFQATEQSSLANQMNTLAWLIANTEGNFEEALHLSRKACSLSPNRSAYLDTLAHCYAALDRYSEAIEQQRRALALEPHQPSLIAALQHFEAQLAASQKKMDDAKR